MSEPPYGLAIETSSRRGSVVIGRGERIVAGNELPEQRRHAVELMPAIDRLCRAQSCGPGDIGCVFVSIGPGSFTGLRVGVTVAKVLAYATGAKLIGVPTLRVVAANAPPDAPRIAVMLNAKGGRCFTGTFTNGRADQEPQLMAPDQLGEVYRGPIICDCPADHDWPDVLIPLDAALARPRAEAVWRIGCELAAEGRYVAATELTPMYVRRPDAEDIWRRRNRAPKEESQT